jgi:uncharacterized protein (TIGR03382 family)
MRHNDVIGASGLSAIAVYPDAVATLTDNLVAFSAAASEAIQGTTLTETYGAFWANPAGNTLVALGPGSFSGQDPRIVPGSACEWSSAFRFPGSPLLDAGDPAGPPDADGSPADIGALGGPEAPVLPDADADGFPTGVDCDDLDPAVTATYGFPDLDGDGYGVSGDALVDCGQAGIVFESGDCDDQAMERSPGLPELCNLVDDDCNGLIDEEDPNLEPSEIGTWYLDADGDGWGDEPVSACAQPVDTREQSGDCDDSDPSTYPGAPDEHDDGRDQDCDGDFGPPAPAPDPGDEPPETAEPEPEGCGCQTAGPPMPALACLALALLGRRRRLQRRA